VSFETAAEEAARPSHWAAVAAMPISCVAGVTCLAAVDVIESLALSRDALIGAWSA